MKFITYLKNDAVLSISFVLAAVSAIFVPPDAEYAGYLNLSVLSILFCLMLVVAGFRSAGLFDVFNRKICAVFKTEKSLIAFMTFVCFFSSALVTNDIALITFVPFTIAMLASSDAKVLIFAVTLETVAANLGSLITPVGNPQNLFLYTTYTMSPAEFFKVTLPLGAICALLVAGMLLMCRHKKELTAPGLKQSSISKKHLTVYTLMFVICILSVFDVLNYLIMLAVVSAVVFFTDRRLFAKADYNLLVTFVCFFVFVGNIARIDAVYSFVSSVLSGRELFFSALLSQVISNVPAATMLAPFTQNAEELILGTNIGGLGTLIASMASLISYRQICGCEKIRNSDYVIYFTKVNLAMLIILLAIYIPGRM